MAVKQAPVFLVDQVRDPKRSQFKVWTVAATIVMICLAALAAFLQARPTTSMISSGNEKNAQPLLAPSPVGTDARLDELKATYGKADDKMTRVDSVIVERVRWRALADLGSVDGQPPLVPPALLDARFPGALKSLDSDAFFIFQRGPYKPGPYVYDWRVIVLDDATNTAMLEEGGKGLPPAYVGRLTPVSQVQPPVSNPPEPVPPPRPRPSNPSDPVPTFAPRSVGP